MELSETILYVDDDKPVLVAFARTVKLLGFDVDTAHGAHTALEMAREKEYAVIATDYLMPEINGLSLINSLKEIQPHATYMVISGQCDLEVAAEAINDHGISNLVTKPWDADDLTSMLRRGIEGYWERMAQNSMQRRLADWTRDLKEQKGRLEDAIDQGRELMAEALLNALDLRTRETRAHCRRVAAYALILAEEMGLRGAAVSSLQHGALLHDVGKIGVPDNILGKPGPLTEEEWTVMREHSAMGARILDGFEALRGAKHVVLQHHERWDGSGYPGGLAGTEIRVEARILSVADALDAILSHRPYRSAASFAIAAKRVREAAGTQFDAEVVEAFNRVPAERWQEVRERYPDEQTDEVVAA
jgi:putative nucleotidyltransferase with HDIG domain